MNDMEMENISGQGDYGNLSCDSYESQNPESGNAVAEKDNDASPTLDLSNPPC